MKFEAKFWNRKVKYWINNENSLLWSLVLLTLCLLKHSNRSPGAKSHMTHILLIPTTELRSWCINNCTSVQFVDYQFFCYSLFMHKITFSALHSDRKFLNCRVLQMWWILLKFWSIIFCQFKCLPQCSVSLIGSLHTITIPYKANILRCYAIDHLLQWRCKNPCMSLAFLKFITFPVIFLKCATASLIFVRVIYQETNCSLVVFLQTC